MLFDIIQHPGSISLIDVIVRIISGVAVIFLTMPIHEFAHAWAATKLGDPTPRYLGRLSLNPFNHIDYMGALCIILFGFGWAKPVTVNSRNFDNPKIGMAATAFAGPLSNLLVAFVSIFLYFGVARAYFAAGVIALAYLADFFYFVASINVTLAVFNLIPIPPLDGSRLLGVILPDRIYYKLMQYERYLYYAVLALIVIGAFDLPLGIASNKIMSLLSVLPQKIFF